jgi:hypothetical protein
MEVSPGAVQPGRRFSLDGPILAGNQHHNLAPHTGQSGDILSGKFEGRRKISVRLQWIHQKETADDRLHISNALNPAGNFPSGGIGDGNQMECIADTEEFPQERPGNIVLQFLE